MVQRIATVALVVPDYDQALDYYCGVLNFDKLQDEDLGQGKRWVRVAPQGGQTALLLAEAQGQEQERAIGNQTGGRVGFFLETNDFEADFAAFKEKGVTFIETPRYEPYGCVVVFQDPFGNKWDLLQLKEPTP